MSVLIKRTIISFCCLSEWLQFIYYIPQTHSSFKGNWTQKLTPAIVLNSSSRVFMSVKCARL